MLSRFIVNAPSIKGIPLGISKLRVRVEHSGTVTQDVRDKIEIKSTYFIKLLCSAAFDAPDREAGEGMNETLRHLKFQHILLK